MNDPIELQSIIYRMLQVGAIRSNNRARINSVFNGDPPMTEQEAEANHAHTNTNFLRGTIQIHRARQQAINALTGPSNFFTCKLDTGPQIKRQEWADIVGMNANKIMKRSRVYDNTLLASIGQTVLHGIGPSTWMDCDEWWPTARGIDEVFVPSNTLLSLTNVTYFAVKITFTIVELLRYIDGKFTDPGWNRELILKAVKVLKERKNENQGSAGYDAYRFPEKWEEDFKEHAIFLGSDAVPVLHCYDFYFFDAESDPKCWKRRIIVDRWIDGFTGDDLSKQFIYSSEKGYGDDIAQILHAQIADGCVVHPGRWWTVRSLGYLLYRVAHLDNRLQSRFFDAVFESTNTYFHNIQEGDRERIEKIDLRHLGIIPAGLSWVPANERQQVNYQLLEGALGMLQNSIQENSSSYTQNVTSGSNKEKTATEVLTQAHEAQQLLSTMLSQIYKCQVPQYREILRRLFTTNHPDCRTFRARCQADGVDKAVFDIEAWDLTPEKAMGSGNRVVQLAEARALMEIRPNLTPRSQVILDHIYVESVTSDPGMARELVPVEAPEPSTTQEKATLAWATLLDNKPVILTGDVNRNEFVQTMMLLLEKEFMDMGQGDQPDERRIIGLGNIITTVEGVVQSLASDESQLERIKVYTQQLAQMRNLLKAAAQQFMKSQDSGQPQDGEMASKLITAQSDAKISEAMAAQKLANKQAQFDQGMAHKDAKTAAEIEAMGARTQVELAATRARNRIENAIATQPSAEE